MSQMFQFKMISDNDVSKKQYNTFNVFILVANSFLVVGVGILIAISSYVNWLNTLAVLFGDFSIAQNKIGLP